MGLVQRVDDLAQRVLRRVGRRGIGQKFHDDFALLRGGLDARVIERKRVGGQMQRGLKIGAKHGAGLGERGAEIARVNIGARGGEAREFDLIVQTLARIERTRAVGRERARVVEQFQFARVFAARVRVEREIKTVFAQLFARGGVGGGTNQFLPLRHGERDVIRVARPVCRARALFVQLRQRLHRLYIVGRKTRGGFQFRHCLREKIIAARRGFGSQRLITLPERELRVGVVGILRDGGALREQSLPVGWTNECDAGVGFGAVTFPQPRQRFAVKFWHDRIERDKLFARRFGGQLDADARRADGIFPAIADERAIRETRKKTVAQVLGEFADDGFLFVGFERYIKGVPIDGARRVAVHHIRRVGREDDGLIVQPDAKGGKLRRVKCRVRARLRGKTDADGRFVGGIGIVHHPLLRALRERVPVAFIERGVHNERGEFDRRFAVERRERDEDVGRERLRGERRDSPSAERQNAEG